MDRPEKERFGDVLKSATSRIVEQEKRKLNDLLPLIRRGPSYKVSSKNEIFEEKNETHHLFSLIHAEHVL